MHDKTVRRRRAVLALLVVLSLILISASFGSSGAGVLHNVQSGFLDVIAPIESGASKVLTPVHDLSNWISDITSAAGQRDKLRKELESLQGRYVKLQALERNNEDAAGLLGLDRHDGIDADGPVLANVALRSDSLLVQTLTIDVGSSSGVSRLDPVVCAAGLVGTVTSVAADASQVTLIDDNTANEAAIDNADDEFGIVSADPGNPNLLTFQVSNPSAVSVGDFVVTAGGALTGHASRFPANVPIGTVQSLQTGGTSGTATAIVAPAANFNALGTLQVLTRVTP